MTVFAGPGSTDFYGAVAQIIPILVLVLVVEQRDEKRRFGPVGDLFYVAITIAAASIGEIVALRELYRGHAYPQDQYIVIASLLICTASLVGPIGASSLRQLENRRIMRVLAQLAVFLILYVVIVVVVLVIQQP